MSQDYKIHTYTDDDGEVVQFTINGDAVATFSSCHETPEDNSCSRMGIARGIEKIFQQIGLPEMQGIVAHEYGEMPWD